MATLSEININTYAERYVNDEKMNGKLSCKDSSKRFVQIVFGKRDKISNPHR